MTMFQTIAALIAVNVLFGLSYPFTKAILGYLSPVSWVFIRLFMATVILGLSQYRSIKADIRLFKKAIWIIAAALFGAVINQLCFNEGLLRTSPAHAAILNATIPIQTLVFASVLSRERLHAVKVIGILLGFCGVVYLIGFDHLTRLNPFAIGDMLILTNAASYSIYLILAKRYLSGLKPLVVLFWMSLLATITVGFYANWPFSVSVLVNLPIKIIGMMFALIVGVTVVCYAVYLWAMRRVDASYAALFVYFQPLVATALSYLMFHDQPSPRFYVSAVLILIGLLLSSK